MIKLPSLKLPQNNEFLRDKYFLWCLRINLLIFISCLLLFLIFWQKIPPVIPFFYSLTWGEEQLASPILLILLILTVFLLNLLNIAVSFFTYKRSIYLAHLLLISSIATIILTAITIVKIILLVT